VRRCAAIGFDGGIPLGSEAGRACRGRDPKLASAPRASPSSSGASLVRIAVVTPYYQESREVLERCIASVRAQSVPVDQILVADGHPQYWFEDAPNVTHAILRKRAGDYGDTPRSVGLVMAVRSQYEIVQFLDADNFLLPDHFEVTLRHFRGRAEGDYPDIVLARREMLRPDGSIIAVEIPEEETFRHVDTNCFVFYRTSFHVAIKWSLIPREISFIDDRVFFALLAQRHPELRTAFNETRTVGYTCLWDTVYRMAGEKPPPNSKNMGAQFVAAQRWWRGLDAHSKQVIERTLGLPILLPEDAPGRSL